MPVRAMKAVSPQQPFRGIHYDLARGNYDTISSLRRLVRFLSEQKINKLVLYMEDLWRYQRHPQLANLRHAYNLEAMGELAEYASSRCGVDLIPSLTTLGHSFHILEKTAYRSLAFPGPGADFDIFNPAVYDLFSGLFDEILPYFKSSYFFINGDEVHYIHLSDRARSEAKKHGLGYLYGTGMGRLARMVMERGRRPIMWHDMLLHHPESIPLIPRETIIAYWYYEYQPDFPAINFFRRKGFDVIAAPGICSPNIYQKAMVNIKGQAQAAADAMFNGINAGKESAGACLGTMTTIWETANWKDAVLPIYATGRWTNDARLSEEKVLRDFGADIFGSSEPRLGRWLLDSSLESERLNKLVKCVGEKGFSSAEKAALERECSRVKRRRSIVVSSFQKFKPARRNKGLYRHLVATATRNPVFKGGSPEKQKKGQDLLSLKFVDNKNALCQIVEGRTPYGHKLLVLTNGLISVALLPEFGATMVEWVLLGKKPWSAILSGYHNWASAEQRIPGDLGLGSPFSASAIYGWRETIFYNARLNPCSLWGRSFRTQTLYSSPDKIAVEFLGENEVADVRRTIILKRGQKTIEIETTATNRLEPSFLALQPNVVHTIPPGNCLPLLRVKENKNKSIFSRSILKDIGMQQFPPRGNLIRIESPVSGHYIELRFQRKEIDTFLLDYGSDVFFTLEPQGVVRYCRKGEGVSLHLTYRLG